MAKALKVVGKVASVAAVVLAFIPGGQPFAAAASAISAVANAGAQLLHVPEPQGGAVSKVVIDTSAPTPYVMGRTMTGGALVHDAGYGSTYKKIENPNRSMVFVYSDCGPVQEIEGLYSDGAFQTAAGAVSGYYSGNMHFARQLGNVPEASAMSGNQGLIPRWGGAYKLSAKAAGIVTMRWDKDMKKFSAGAPELTVLLKGVKVYSARNDSTYPGGDGPCRLGVESTYIYSENPSDHAVTYLFGRYENGKRIFGVGKRRESIDLPAFVEWANVCDANNWKIGGVLYEPADKWNNLKNIMQAGSAKPVHNNGTLSVLFDAPKVALETFTEDDLANGDVTIPATQSFRDRINGIIPRYRSSDHNWEYVPGTAVSIAQYVTLDGEDKRQERQYTFVQNATQAAQIAAYEIVNARELDNITLPLKPKVLPYGPGEAIELNMPNLGLVGTFVIVSRRFDPLTAITEVIVQTETASKHSFALGASTTPPEIPALAFGEDLDNAAFTASGGESVLQTMIATSWARNLTVTSNPQGPDADIVISNHSRVYPDDTISVLGDTITGFTYGTRYSLYYDDTNRDGGAVTYVATIDHDLAQTSDTTPSRHFIGYVTTPINSSSPATSGVVSLPPTVVPETVPNAESIGDRPASQIFDDIDLLRADIGTTQSVAISAAQVALDRDAVEATENRVNDAEDRIEQIETNVEGIETQVATDRNAVATDRTAVTASTAQALAARDETNNLRGEVVSLRDQTVNLEAQAQGHANSTAADVITTSGHVSDTASDAQATAADRLAVNSARDDVTSDAQAVSVNLGTVQTLATQTSQNASAAQQDRVDAQTAAGVATSERAIAVDARNDAEGFSVSSAQSSNLSAEAYDRARGLEAGYNNLIAGGQFEGDPQWRLIEGEATGHKDFIDDSIEGRVLRLDDSQGSTARAYGCLSFKVETGNTLRVGARLKSSASGDNGLYFRISYGQSYSKYIGGSVSDPDVSFRYTYHDFISGVSNTVTNSFEDYEFDIVVPPNVEWASVAIYNWTGSPSDIQAARVWAYDRTQEVLAINQAAIATAAAVQTGQDLSATQTSASQASSFRDQAQGFRDTASAQASIATNAATQTSADLSATNTSRDQASQFRDQAQGFRDSATSQAAIATSQATVATGAASTATAQQILTAQALDRSLGLEARANSIVPGGLFKADPNWVLVEGGSSGHFAIIDDASEGRVLTMKDSINGNVRAYGSPAFKVTPGRKYRFGFRGKNIVTSGPGGIYFRLNIKDTFAEHILGSIRYSHLDLISGVHSVISSDYQEYEYEWTAPSFAEWVSLCFYNWSPGTSDLYVSEAWGYDVTDFSTLEASVATNAQAIALTDGRLAATIGLRAQAGTSGAELELVALSNPTGSASAARLRADNILLDGTVTADHMNVSSLSAMSANIGILRTASSGARMEIRDNKILVYDASGTLRVKIGDLS